MTDPHGAAAAACAENGIGRCDLSFEGRKEFFYSWRRSADTITIVLSDYVEDAPETVVHDLCDMICRRSLNRRWREPESFLRYVDSDGFITAKRPVYIKRSRNLSGTEQGEHHNLLDSLDRLLDSGLLQPSDIENSWMSWTVRQAVRRVGFCSTMMRVVGVSSALDDPGIPDFVRDYVVYHESLHLRQRYRFPHSAHDPEFRSWERRFPLWREAEDRLRRL